MRLLAVAALALALSAPAASARGYLHMADASRAAGAKAAGLVRTYRASSSDLQGCTRRAARSVVCAAEFTGVVAFGQPDWTLDTFLDVRLVHGRIVAAPRL